SRAELSRTGVAVDQLLDVFPLETSEEQRPRPRLDNYLELSVGTTRSPSAGHIATIILVLGKLGEKGHTDVGNGFGGGLLRYLAAHQNPGDEGQIDLLLDRPLGPGQVRGDPQVGCVGRDTSANQYVASGVGIHPVTALRVRLAGNLAVVPGRL